MTFIEKKAEEYVSREFPNADFGYCGHQSERYKAAFLAGYEQCKEDLMCVVEEIYARVENIRIDVADCDKDAVIEETRAIEAVLNTIRRVAD